MADLPARLVAVLAGPFRRRRRPPGARVFDALWLVPGRRLHGGELARICYLSLPTTYRAIDKLLDAGLIGEEWIEPARADGRPRHRYYFWPRPDHPPLDDHER